MESAGGGIPNGTNEGVGKGASYAEEVWWAVEREEQMTSHFDMGLA